MHFNRAEKHARRVRGSNSSEGLCEKFPGTSSKSLEKVVVGMELPVLNTRAAASSFQFVKFCIQSLEFLHGTMCIVKEAFEIIEYIELKIHFAFIRVLYYSLARLNKRQLNKQCEM